MRQFLPPFDHVVLLRAPREVVVARLATRTHNPSGKHPDHVARELALRETVEPVLRRAAGYEIDTNACLDDGVEHVLRIVQSGEATARERPFSRLTSGE